jgi:ABC-type sugar transport system ATPase subunit
MTLADRIVALDYGQVQQIGTPDDLYNAPTNKFVAGFIGSPKINFLAATVLSTHGDTIEARVDGLEDTRITLTATGMHQGDKIDLGIRPEELHIADAGPPQDTVLRFSGTVEIADRLGNITYAYVNAGLDNNLTVQTFQKRKIQTDTQVNLTVPANRIDVFNTQGNRCSPAKP